MKAYTLDLRERVIQFVQAGGSKAEAARRFAVGRRTVYRYLAAATAGTLAPKTTWGTWRKLDPQKLQAHVRQQPDATLQELATVFGRGEGGVDHRLCRESGRSPRGERIYEAVPGKRRERTRLISAARHGKRDRAGQRQLPSLADDPETGRSRRLSPAVLAGLRARPQPH